MDTKELCLICGEGHVTHHVDQFESEYKGQKAMLPSHYKLCDTCHSDFAGSAEGKLNKRAIMAFRKSVDGLLTGTEIVALRKQYSLTQDQAAQLFGGGPVAFSKYENDDVSQSEAMDSLLRLVRASEAAFEVLVNVKGMAAELSHALNSIVTEKTITLTASPSNVFDMAKFRISSVKTSARTTFTMTSDESRLWK